MSTVYMGESILSHADVIKRSNDSLGMWVYIQVN